MAKQLEDEIFRLLQLNKSVDEIGELLGIGSCKVYQVIARNQWDTPAARRRKSRQKKIMELWEAGKSFDEIMAACDVSPFYLSRMGLTRNPDHISIDCALRILGMWYQGKSVAEICAIEQVPRYKVYILAGDARAAGLPIKDRTHKRGTNRGAYKPPKGPNASKS